MLPENFDRGRLSAMLAGSGDCIAFTSPSTIKNLAKLFDTHDLGKALPGVVIACIGSVTATAAVEYGLHVDIQPANSQPPIWPRPSPIIYLRLIRRKSAANLNCATLARMSYFAPIRIAAVYGELVGNSESIRKIYSLIEQVAPSSASVLITGESGTGKELVARTIHKMSPRHDKPFVAINCSAIPESLMESELFGHEKGAFTGAASRRQGCFELADTGTLLLDEIGEMPALLQAKLLRVIEERAVRRLGSRKEIEVDVRLLAATNRQPQQAVAEGKLRSDLLYRLNVFGIHLPSLRERKEDLPLLAQHLVTQLAEKHGRPARFLSSAAIEALQFHSWPGNVRELRNVIERAVIICSGEQVERHHFAPYPIEQRERLRNEDTLSLPVGTPLEEVERQMIMRTLQKTKNNKTRAAELLGISLKTLHNKLNLYRERGLLHDDDTG